MAPGLVRSRWDGGALPVHSPLPSSLATATGMVETRHWFLQRNPPRPTAPLVESSPQDTRHLPASHPSWFHHIRPTIKSKFPPHSSCVHVKAEGLSFPPLQHCRVFTNNDLGQRISHQKNLTDALSQIHQLFGAPQRTHAGSDKGFKTGDQSPKITTTTLMFG